MAKTIVFEAGQKTVNLATTNGAARPTGAVAGTNEFDTYVIPEGTRYGMIQISYAPGVSASFITVGYKILTGIDGTNWYSLFSTSNVNSLGSGSANIFFLPSTITNFRYIKLSCGSISYGACTLSANSIQPVTFFPVR
jgi:hypothetical protein